MSLEIPYRLHNGTGNPPDARKYMANWDWLTALLFGDFLSNGGMELWDNGTSFTNPANGTALATLWTLRKSGTSSPTANVDREASVIDDGTYSAKADITVAGSADSMLAFDQSISSYENLRGFTVCFGFMVRASTASRVRLKITDGVSTVYSNAYHTGGGTYEQLNAIITIAAAAASITASIEVTSDFTGAIYMDSGFLYVIPANMTATARGLLRWSKLLSLGIDLIVPGAGRGIICTTPDGLHTARLGIDNNYQPLVTPLT